MHSREGWCTAVRDGAQQMMMLNLGDGDDDADTDSYSNCDGGEDDDSEY